MRPDEALARLCELFGIQAEYPDIWGERHRVPAATQRALLAAMGVVPAKEQDLARTCADWEQRPWRRLLEPVWVARDDELPVKVVLRVPEAGDDVLVQWEITQEDGARHSGQLGLSELEVLERREVEGLSHVAVWLPMPSSLPHGYHELRVDVGQRHDEMSLILAPRECHWPAELAADAKMWGAALQLYALRSRRNWGIGDFSDLRVIVEHFGQLGAGIIGVNPLHALFPHNPVHASPYSPSSRQLLNVFCLDVEAIPEFAQCAQAQELVYSQEFQDQLVELRHAEVIDYEKVVGAKRQVLEILYQFFRDHHVANNTDSAHAFRAFLRERGERLERQALYEAIQEKLWREDRGQWGWPAWPKEYRRPDSETVAAFADQHRDRVEFFAYLQWHAESQLAEAAHRAEIAGTRLYQDLAVSSDLAGAEVWADQDLYAQNVSIGAPPDDFSLQGQNWGLPPWIPHRLREAAYRPFITALRANMRHARALRIDHVMALMRLFWIPDGVGPRDGAYVHYPFADLLGILALESQRNRCLVVGEDLGTVPNEVRDALAPMRVLSYRLLYFEREQNGKFKPPDAYPAQALATVSTHDLPTLAGYWKGQDIVERRELGQFPDDEVREQQILKRAEDRAKLLMALRREGLLPEGVSVDPASCPDMTDALARAIHAFVARAEAKIMMVQLEDIVLQRMQVNLPGTTDERPNWRHRLPENIEDLVTDARVRKLAGVLRQQRALVSGPGAAAGGSDGLTPTSVPRATYRLQFNRDFTFADATDIIPYLSRLGISHCYASPYLTARAGSTHGYDIVDHNVINPEIGSSEDYERFVEELQANDMGQILDTVPNHMGVGTDNVWWLDVLENGPSSLYADFFDIDWQPLKEELRSKVLIPILGASYGEILEGDELRFAFNADRGSFEARYWEHHFPIDPKTYPLILGHDLSLLSDELGEEDRRLVEFETLITGFRNLPDRDETHPELVRERNRDKEVHKLRLAELYAASASLRNYIEAVLRELNAVSESGASIRHELLEQQAYRLAYWRVATDEINYRRFFDINELAGLRMENPKVFFATHRLITDLVLEGKVNGLRIDHPDGLHDPQQYFQRLQDHVAPSAAGATDVMDRPSTDVPPRRRPLYVVVEKILAAHEHLIEDWPVHGTSGYEFANLLTGLFVHANSERQLSRIYTRFVGHRIDFDDLLYERKKLIMRVSLSSELQVLANQLNRISEYDWHTRDFTLTALRDALMEVVACFPVYRTYVSADHVSADDRRDVEWAVAKAKKLSPAAEVTVFDFIRDVLLLERVERLPEEYRRVVIEFAMRFQQYTAPVMAKGLEDTSFYIYNRLVCLNEVGGEPRRYGVSRAAFHRANQERARRWPYTMLSTSTHDSKRSEDVRSRIAIVSEAPEAWRRHLQRWTRINRSRKRRVDERPAPSRNDEYLLYQTLLGVWPSYDLDETGHEALRERVEGYMLKAVREAKVHTSWVNRNEEYENAVSHFVRALFVAPEKNPFLRDFVPFCRRLARAGALNSLSQVLLKLTVPGVPDIYQGNEILTFSLVDPDNRRPVDYVRREAVLDALEKGWQPADDRGGFARGLLDDLFDGRAKMFVTWRALQLRKELPALFESGDYVPLKVHGVHAENVIAFARRLDEEAVIIAVPRWLWRMSQGGELPLGNVWHDTFIEVHPKVAHATFVNELTGEVVKTEEHRGKARLCMTDVGRSFPLAILRSPSP